MLGYHLSQGKRRLGRSDPLVSTPRVPETAARVASTAYGSPAGLLYATLKGDTIGLLHWVPDQEGTFQKLKQHLGEALALALPEVTHPFHLYVREKGGIGSGVLTQPLGHGTGQ
jgi:hypothetical protein